MSHKFIPWILLVALAAVSGFILGADLGDWHATTRERQKALDAGAAYREYDNVTGRTLFYYDGATVRQKGPLADPATVEHVSGLAHED